MPNIGSKLTKLAVNSTVNLLLKLKELLMFPEIL